MCGAIQGLEATWPDNAQSVEVPFFPTKSNSEVVGLYPTSQTTDFVVATALAELARRQKAAIGLQMTLSRLLAARQQYPNCGADAVNHSGFEGLPGSIPTAPTNHPICLEHRSDFARRQKAAIRNKMGLLGGTDGSSKAKSDCGLNCSPYFEESQASSTVKDTLDSAEDLHAGVTFMISRNRLNCLGKWPSKAICYYAANG